MGGLKYFLCLKMFKRWRLIFIKIGCVASLFSALNCELLIIEIKKNVKERLIRTTQFISVWSFERSKFLIVFYYSSREAFLTDFDILMGDDIFFLFIALGLLKMMGYWNAHAPVHDNYYNPWVSIFLVGFSKRSKEFSLMDFWNFTVGGRG